jgi:ADP-heptose:LPS heptosyltransferase
MPAMFDPSQLRRVLVTKLRHHGDVLLATPVLSTLKRIAPQCEIDALVYADTSPMIEDQSVRAATSQPVVDFSGQLRLKQLAALSAQVRLFVGVDSAPMHIAVAMDTPMGGIFGPSGDREWGPWENAGANRHRVVASLTHDCRPCGRVGCNDSKFGECLTNLPVDQVLATCEEMLA